MQPAIDSLVSLASEHAVDLDFTDDKPSYWLR